MQQPWIPFFKAVCLLKALINVVDCPTSKEEKDLRACLEDLDREEDIPAWGTSFEELKIGSPSKKTKVELKILPNHLKYVFLEENVTKPVVINSELIAEEENRLVEVLKRHREAIGWHISDLKGISSAYCMHKIMMEEDYRLVRQPQRRLNPSMKEKVRKEVLLYCNIWINMLMAIEIGVQHFVYAFI